MLPFFRKEQEDLKAKWNELRRKDSQDAEEKLRNRRVRSRERSRDRTPERSREREQSRERSRDRRDKRDRSYERRERSRDRRRQSRSPSPVERDSDRSSLPSLDSKSLPSLTLAEKKKLKWERERGNYLKHFLLTRNYFCLIAREHRDPKMLANNF